MVKVNIHEAKNNLSKLVERASQGEDILIARNGKALVRLVSIEKPRGLRPVGLHRKKLSKKILKESLQPLDEEALSLWYSPDLPKP
jgi:prevent-host-death family protein